MSIGLQPASARRVGNFTTPPAMTVGGAARVPSAVRPVNVVASVTVTATNGQDRTVALEVETGVGTAVYLEIARWRSAATVGLGNSTVDAAPATITIPPGVGYRFTQTGTGTVAITTHREQLA